MHGPCTRCGGVRDSRNASQKSGLDPRCKACHRDIQQERRDAGLNQEREHWYKIEKKYGISKKSWFRLFRRQHGCCAICHTPFEDGPYGGRICVDHDHATGKVRGLLCVDCNHGLGKFKDNPLMLDNAAEYIRLHARQGVKHDG